MNYLVLQVRFIAHSYSGIRILNDRSEELDWPPSPGRILEALLSAALLGMKLSSEQREETDRAFAWFECLPAPEIWTTAQDESLRTRPRLAIPQNNPNKSKFDQHSILLDPTVKAVPRTGQALEVRYHWQIESMFKVEEHFAILEDAAARVSYLGRAEDRAELNLRILDKPEPTALIRWKPDPFGHAPLCLPRIGTTAYLCRRHLQQPQWRQLPKPAQDEMDRVSYSDDSPFPRQPIEVAIFQIFLDSDDPDERPCSCDAVRSGYWREFFRNKIISLAKEDAYWDNPSLAAELLSGHNQGGTRAVRPHLAVVPLPTFNRGFTADGRVRRVALIGYAATEVQCTAAGIYHTLFRALDDLVDEGNDSGGKPTNPFSKDNMAVPIRLRRVPNKADKIWSQLNKQSRVWASVTPVAISRGFKVPKFTPDGKRLSSNERYLRKLAEWENLLRDSLRHIQLPEELVNATEIQISTTPFLPKCERAEKFRAPGEKSVLVHVRLAFPESVRGPLLLGDRRYFGLGLFVPVEILIASNTNPDRRRQDELATNSRHNLRQTPDTTCGRERRRRAVIAPAASPPSSAASASAP